MSIESMMPYNHLIFCHPLLLLPSVFPSIRSFLVNWFFTSGGQSIGASASASVLPMNIQGWFPLGLTGLISFQSKGLSGDFSRTTASSLYLTCKHASHGAQEIRAFLSPETLSLFLSLVPRLLGDPGPCSKFDIYSVMHFFVHGYVFMLGAVPGTEWISVKPKNESYYLFFRIALMAQTGKNLPANAGAPGWIPGSGRSPGGGHGNPLQYSCLENPMDREAYQATVYGDAKRRKWLSNSNFSPLPHWLPIAFMPLPIAPGGRGCYLAHEKQWDDLTRPAELGADPCGPQQEVSGLRGPHGPRAEA